MKPTDNPLSVFKRSELKSTPQELINLERTAQLYSTEKPLMSLSSNVPFKGAWDSGRIA
ncbi:hypothetical protein L1889_18020 [Paenalcaligenes niemegkensis]|uniref:hypothetical protein n=1 Tax=Paenalcaligenes niemegkensis TaxID=2895469 RepID=UPI001EE801ED|nr:hypothetical protein [Paenalcaligenes niemegkensis]MCQ9618337.1 hypothetical protein [Paenalcaligenes niemegkensis]